MGLPQAIKGAWATGAGGAGGGAHIGILFVQVLVLLVQDVVGIPDLLPHAHGLGGEVGSAAAPAPPRGSWLCPSPCRSGAKGLGTRALTAATRWFNGYRMWKGSAPGQPVHLEARWGSGGVRGGKAGSVWHVSAEGLLWVLASLLVRCSVRPWPPTQGAVGLPGRASRPGSDHSPRLGQLPPVSDLTLQWASWPTAPSACKAPTWALSAHPPSPGPSSWTRRPSSAARPASPQTLPALYR